MQFRNVITCHCDTCGQNFTKVRRRGSLTKCRPCGNRERLAAWHLAHPGRKHENNARWSATNREKDRALKARWQKANPATGAAKTRRRHADKANRTPAWADHVAIRTFYEVAARVTRCTGIPFHVDHIVPLRGKTVSGLHVHNNLRVIPGVLNMRKGNRFGETA